MRDAVGIVLAAGKGTRMKSRLPKAVHPLCGKPMGRYTVDLCRAAGVRRVVVVVGHDAETVRAAIGPDVEYVTQEQQLGTGHAVQQAVAGLAGFRGTVLVLQADTPLVTPDLLDAMILRHEESDAAATLLSTVLEDAAHYGRVVRAGGGLGRVERIVERKDASPEIAAIREINAGMYVFEAEALFPALSQLDSNNRQGEYYLTDVIGIFARAGKHVEAFVSPDPRVALGINDRIELAAAAAIVRERTLKELMASGVSIVDPATTYVDAGVRIAPDTTLHPLTFLAGATEIGGECEIGPDVQITDCRIGERVRIRNAVLAESEVGDETRIGPYAQLRPGCRIGRGCKIGNFVELKKAVLEDRVSVGHLTYVGDAFVGARTNVGAGTITCNYDGKHKHVTRIGPNCFIGSHVTLIAPVEVGEGAYVAAASPVTQDVPPDALVVARCRPTVKEGWAARRRERDRDEPEAG